MAVPHDIGNLTTIVAWRQDWTTGASDWVTSPTGTARRHQWPREDSPDPGGCSWQSNFIYLQHPQLANRSRCVLRCEKRTQYVKKFQIETFHELREIDAGLVVPQNGAAIDTESERSQAVRPCARISPTREVRHPVSTRPGRQVFPRHALEDVL
jgi:hypothetical protein